MFQKITVSSPSEPGFLDTKDEGITSNHLPNNKPLKCGYSESKHLKKKAPCYVNLDVLLNISTEMNTLLRPQSNYLVPLYPVLLYAI